MRNKIFEEFDIHLLSINNETKCFEFQINETFFKEFEQDIIEKGNLSVKAEITKTHSMITVDLLINGELELVCDRSLEKFQDPFYLETTLFFKYGEEFTELDVNLYQIKENTTTLNLANYLMECILVEVPIRKIHPKYKGDDKMDSDEPFFQTEINDDDNEEKIDPRWAELTKLKKKTK